MVCRPAVCSRSCEQWTEQPPVRHTLCHGRDRRLCPGTCLGRAHLSTNGTHDSCGNRFTKEEHVSWVAYTWLVPGASKGRLGPDPPGEHNFCRHRRSGLERRSPYAGRSIAI